MKRIITGLIIGGGWLLLIFFGAFQVFWLAITVAGGLALYEYCRMALTAAHKKYSAWFVAGGLLPLLATCTGRLDAMVAALFLSLFFLFNFILLKYRDLSDPFELAVRAGFGILYPGFVAAHLVLLRAQPQGVYWILLLTAVTVASDTGAYYIGRWLGRTKLCPAISPGKTVAGALGGFAAGMLAALGVAVYFLPGVGLAKIAALAFVLVWVGIVGDLTESIIKRAAGVKDSGSFLAGHGGLLDRIDSLLLAGPVLYYITYFNLLVTG